MAVQALGYLGISTQNIDEWSDFATRQLGCSWSTVRLPAAPSAWMIVASELSLTRSVRMPSAFLGGRSPTPQAWTLLRPSSKRPALPYDVNRRRSPIRRFVRDLISFRDPDGNRLEAFHGPLLADTPFAPGRNISGFRTGALGMGHVVLMVADFDAALAFYVDLLGFQISDFMREPQGLFPACQCPPPQPCPVRTALGTACITS